MRVASRTIGATVSLLSGVLLAAGPAFGLGDEPVGLTLRVDAGRYDRRGTPVSVEIPSDRLPEAICREAAERPLALRLRVEGQEEAIAGTVISQADRLGSGDDAPIRLTWTLAGRVPSGTSRTYRWRPEPDVARDVPWTFERSEGGQLELSHEGRPVFRYNRNPVRHPDHDDPRQPRDAYIHPAYAPSGAVITGDYSKESHPHHRGLFLAYTKTEVGDLHPDFWNIQGGGGKVHFDRLEGVAAGPVTARFTAFHRWEAERPGADPLVVLRERWDVEAYAIPGSPYRLFDLTSTQRATDEPMVLPPYRYGGMAYRGPDSFFPEGVLDVLTSEGYDRVRGDQEPARWVDLTGPIEDGSDTYAGAAIFDHPSNVNHPTPARIHPTRLPFFCFVPSHDEEVTIGPDEPTVFRYRILIHDGHPDAERNERIWRDFAEPPTVAIEATP